MPLNSAELCEEACRRVRVATRPGVFALDILMGLTIPKGSGLESGVRAGPAPVAVVEWRTPCVGLGWLFGE